MSLKLNSSGGGSVTLQEPVTASARTLNLPNVDGTVVSTSDTGTITPAMLSTGAPSWTSAGVLSFNSGYGSVAIAYGCRAWVNFNGTGTVAIRASGNVTSITDNGTGDYTVNFTNALVDANYAVLGTSGQSAAVNNMNCVGRNLDNSVQTTTAVRLYNLVTNTSGAVDNPNIFVGIFR
jgi:hypothetical protein